MAAPMESVFHAALQKILNSWTALQLAVQQEFGGPNSKAKELWMVDATEQWFKENSNLDAWEVEDFLSDILNAEFDTIVDDGTCRQTAEAICECYQLYKAGRQAELTARLSRLPSCETALQQSQARQKDDSTDSDSDEGDDNNKQQGMGTGGACCSHSATAGAAPCRTQPQSSSAESSEMVNGDVDQQQSAEKTEESQMEEDDGWTVVKHSHGKKR